MRLLIALLLALALCPALAQPGNPAKRDFQRQMPPPDYGRRMGGEERQRLREQVRNGQMSRDEARERWREQRARRATEAGRLTPEEREKLRRDVLEANRDLPRR